MSDDTLEDSRRRRERLNQYKKKREGPPVAPPPRGSPPRRRRRSSHTRGELAPQIEVPDGLEQQCEAFLQEAHNKVNVVDLSAYDFRNTERWLIGVSNEASRIQAWVLKEGPARGIPNNYMNLVVDSIPSAMKSRAFDDLLIRFHLA